MIQRFYEFDSFVPGLASLQRPGARKAGNGVGGFYVPEGMALTNIEAVRDVISGPAPARALAERTARRMAGMPAGARGVDLSGWFIKRQLLAAAGEPINPLDRAHQVGYFRPCLADLLEQLPGGMWDLAYVNNETATRDGMPAASAEYVAAMVRGLIPERAGPVMITCVTCGVRPMREWWGEMPRCHPSLFSDNGLRPMLDAWINTRARSGWRKSAAWNGLIETVNDAVSIRWATNAPPVVNIRGIATTETGPTTRHERHVYREQAKLLALLGVDMAVIFNAGGRGGHLKDPATDFAACELEDLDTDEAFAVGERAALAGALRRDQLPTEPIPADADQITLGPITLSYADTKPGDASVAPAGE
jgi:hypothetical protein